MHYNLLAGAAVADRTTVDLHYAATPVAKRALVLPISNRHLRDPAGRVRHGHRRAARAGRIVVGVGRAAAHAPARHRDQACRCSTPAGDATCAIDIPHWNFHWQGFYYYKQPLPVGGGDVVRLACSYDNTAGSTALTWGEKTTDEMCLAFAYVTAR